MAISVLGERLDVALRDGAEQDELEQLVVADRLAAGREKALRAGARDGRDNAARFVGGRCRRFVAARHRTHHAARLAIDRHRRRAQGCRAADPILQWRRGATRVRRDGGTAAGRGPCGDSVKISTPVSVTADGVLELGRQRAVARHRGPAVGQHLHVRAAEIDHRLDREEHAGPQHDAFARPADVHDVGLVVEQAAEAVAAEVAHHAHVLGLDIGLDGGADVAGGRARPDRRDAAHHRLVGDLDQPLGAARDRADARTCGWSRRASRRGSA